jgi:hypothetical protein
MTFARLATFAAAAVLLAACQTSQPSQKVQTASTAELKDSARMFCVRTQATMQKVSAERVASACGCYANATFKALTKEEIEFSRQKGYFDDGGVAKAKKALAKCGLKDPT